MVRGHLAAGTVPLGRRRRDLGAVLDHQRRPAVPRMDGHRAGRHAGRAEAAFDHRRSARPRPSLFRHVRRRRARDGRRRPDLETDHQGHGRGGGIGFDPAEATFHDPHCIRLCPSNPDRLYQQNHCGIYRLDRPSDTWVRIGNTMPKTAGDIGFPMVRAPARRRTAWVFPMDGTRSGRAPAPEASRRSTQRATAARRGSVSTLACRAAGVVDREAPGDGGGRVRPRRAVLRQQPGRTVDQPRRGPALGLHRAAPAGNLRRGDAAVN